MVEKQGYIFSRQVQLESTRDFSAAPQRTEAFGPAAEPMRRFYRRRKSGRDLDETSLAMAYRDLREAARRASGTPESRARVDAVRRYAHFLKHCVKPPATVTQAPRGAAGLARPIT